MNATIMTVARCAAIKAVKLDIQRQGGKLAHIEPRIITAANIYLSEHPELIEEAADTVRKAPQFRTLAEREERPRRRRQR
jgi:hypothetical protein